MTKRRSTRPDVSVVVTTFNRKAALDRMLSGLRAASTSRVATEVIVAMDGCTDGTADALQRFSSAFVLKLIDLPVNTGPAAGRNHALRKATGEVVVFLDDDVIPHPGLIERHLSVHRSDHAAVVIGPMLPPEHGRLPAWLRWEAATLAKQYDAMEAGDYLPTPRQFYTANASVRLSHALGVGGFDETFKRAEDVEFAYRLADRGLRFYYLPDAAVTHLPVRSWKQWNEVAFEYGRHAVIFQRDRGRDQLRLAYSEWPARHWLNRFIAQGCVGHPRIGQTARSVARIALEMATRTGWEPMEMGLCSAVYSVSYWDGVAQETGLGSNVWSADPVSFNPPLLPQSTR